MVKLACSLCGDQPHPMAVVLPCNLCGRVACGNCRIVLGHDPFTGEFLVGHPETVCLSCRETMLPLAEQAETIMMDARKRVGELRNQWIEQCKKN